MSLTAPFAPPTFPSLARSAARPAARVVDAVKTYGRGDARVVALDGVSLDIPRGCFTAIMGPSGSGKSTLMHCLAGLDTLDSGRVELYRRAGIDGGGAAPADGSRGGSIDQPIDQPINLGVLSDRQLTRVRRDHIGFVFQAFNLLPTLSAAENIVLPLKLAGRAVDERWMQLVVETVGLKGRLKHRPSELSGGQQQRVAVARALVAKPELVFADEPTGNLDSRTGAEILTFLRYAVDAYAQTIVMVTHDPVAAGYADQVVFLADGRIVGSLDRPTPDRVLDAMRAL